MDDNQLNIIITIATFFSAVLLSKDNNLLVDGICLNTGCEIVGSLLSITNLSWLICLFITSYIILGKINNVISHKISLLSFVIASLTTLLFIGSISIDRIVYATLITGLIPLLGIFVLLAIMIIIICMYSNIEDIAININV